MLLKDEEFCLAKVPTDSEIVCTSQPIMSRLKSTLFKASQNCWLKVPDMVLIAPSTQQVAVI